MYSPAQLKVINEKARLNISVIDLREFITASPEYDELPLDQQVRLKTQLFLLEELQSVLAARISAFGKR